MPDVFERVRQIVVGQLNVDPQQVTPEAAFADDLGADSLDRVELIMAFEDIFGIEMPDADAEKLRTIQDAVDYIQSHSRITRQ